MRLGTYYRNLLIKHLNFDLNSEKVIEVGCHDGFLVHNLLAKKKVGVDLAPVQIYDDITYIQSDILLYEPKEKFDLIIAIEVMEHIENPNLFVKKIGNLLSSDGRVLLSTPSKNIMMFPYFFQKYIDKRWGHDYRRGFSKDEIESLVSSNLPNKNIQIIAWNQPLFRAIYPVTRTLWVIFPKLAEWIIQKTVNIDSKFREGKHGVFFIYIK